MKRKEGKGNGGMLIIAGLPPDILAAIDKGRRAQNLSIRDYIQALITYDAIFGPVVKGLVTDRRDGNG